MSEKGGAKPAVADNRWSTTAPPQPITEPAGAKKDVGYALNEIPASAHWNWMLWINGLIDNWLTAAHIREFEDVAEALAVTDPGDVFRVGQPPAGNRAAGQQVYSLTPATFTAITGAASDSQKAYYLDTSTAIYAADPADGSQLWAVTPANITSDSIAADGRQVYVTGAAGFAGLVLLSKVTGSETGRAGTPQGGMVAANGVYAAIAGGGGVPNNLYYYVVTASTPIETGFTAHGNPLGDCALDAHNVYFGGARSGGVDVRAHDLATRAQVWAVSIKVGPSPLITSIATDGELVYVATARVASGAGFANLFVLQASDGAVVATADVQAGGSTDNITHLAIDGRLIYCTLSGATASVIAMRMQAPVMYQHGLFPAIVVGWDADGVALIADDGGGNAERYFFMDQPTTFQTVNGSSVERRPFYKLAIPMR